MYAWMELGLSVNERVVEEASEAVVEGIAAAEETAGGSTLSILSAGEGSRGVVVWSCNHGAGVVGRRRRGGGVHDP